MNEEYYWYMSAPRANSMSRARTEQQKALRRERAKERAKRNSVGCEVWERSGVGVKGGLEWSVTNAAIDAAVELTFEPGISDEDWITAALDTYRKSWPEK
jgi:hypothetical protein